MTAPKTSYKILATSVKPMLLFFWSLASLVLVSFLTFHVPGNIAFVIVFSAAVSVPLVRLLPRRRRVWMIVIWGGMAILLSAVLDGHDPQALVDLNRISCSVSAFLFLLIMALSKRPAFSLLLCLIIVGGLVATSLAKYQYTGVPLLWLDLDLAASTWQFLLGMQSTEALVAQLAGVTGIALLWRVDRPVTFGHYPKSWFVALLGGVVLSSSALASGRIATGDDILRMGWEGRFLDPWAIFIGSMLKISSLREPVPFNSSICCFIVQPEDLRITMAPLEKPHVLVILEESTFPPEVLSTWAPQLNFFEQAYPMAAEVVGGGTWLAEYALLHGVPPTAYGPAGHYINLLGPGRVEGRLPVFLKQLGYSTTTVYPVSHRFYGASTFHQSLGMDEFIDCKGVPGCLGMRMSEVHDSRFFEVAERKLRSSLGPAFVFLPTIRQHSPHSGLAQTILSCEGKSEVQCRTLSIYADRLKDSVSEFESLLTRLHGLDREVVVLAFGDHIPADVSKHFPDDDFHSGKKRTFFTVWSNRRGYLTNSLMSGLGKPPAVHNAYLDLVLARAAGFDSPYFAAKESALRACSGAYCPDGRSGN